MTQILIYVLLSVLLLPCGVKAQISPTLARDLSHWWIALPGFTGGAKLYDQVYGSLDHGTLSGMGYSGTSGWSGTTRPGGIAQLNFDATDDMVTTPDNAGFTSTSQPMTLCAWYMGSQVAGTLGALVQTAAQDGVYAGIWFYLYNPGGAPNVRFGFMADASNGFIAATTSTVAVNIWTHVCATHDGTTPSLTSFVLYINGAVQSTGIDTNVGTVTSWGDKPWRIGADTAGSPPDVLLGSLDSVMVWRRALGQAEIQQVMQLTWQDATGLGAEAIAFSSGALPGALLRRSPHVYQ